MLSLSAVAGSLLGLAILLEFATVLLRHQLFHLHVAIVLAILPLFALKMIPVTRRMAGYYVGERAYRAAGPPHIVLRMLAPLLVASLLGVIVSGVAMEFFAQRGWARSMHGASYVLLLITLGAHLLGHAREAGRAIVIELRTRTAGRRVRLALAALAVVAAIIVFVAAPHHVKDVRGDYGPPPGQAGPTSEQN